MKLAIKKIRASHLIVWILNILFLAIIGYSALLVNRLYIRLTAALPYKKPLKITRFNFTEFNKALKSYNDAVGFTAPESGSADPFNNAVPKSR